MQPYCFDNAKYAREFLSKNHLYNWLGGEQVDFFMYKLHQISLPLRLGYVFL